MSESVESKEEKTTPHQSQPPLTKRRHLSDDPRPLTTTTPATMGKKGHRTNKHPQNQPELLFQQGVQHHGRGQWQKAAQLYQKVLQIHPNHTQAMNNLGMILQDQGQWENAAALYQQALTIEPTFAEAHNNLGSLRQQQGNPCEARKHFQKAIASRPDYLEAIFNIGTLDLAQKQWDNARAYLEKALQLNPHHPDILLNLGHACHQQGDLNQALNHYRQAHHRNPHHPQTLYHLGQACQESGQLEEALIHLQEAVTRKPDFPEALNHLGIVLDTLGDKEKAISSFRRAILLKKDFAEALNNYGNVLQKQGDPVQAQEVYLRVLAIKPDYYEAHCNLGGALHQQGRLQEALVSFQNALSICPDFPSAHYNESLVRLLMGDFALGWKKYEWRWLSRDFQPHGLTQPMWEGDRLEGRTILIHCEQGFGDSVQFVRYLPLVKGMGGRIVLLCPPPLEPLFQTMAGIDILITRPSSIPLCSCRVPLLSLPMVLGTTLDSIPREIPYLSADPERVARFREYFVGSAGKSKIGLVWRGNPQLKNDRNRSMHPRFLARLLDRPGCVFVNLQKDTKKSDLDCFSGRDSFFDLSAALVDYADTAALITLLDLVISVDTSVIHLAGALGCPGWVLLPKVPDWRWLLDCDDSPWYPSIRLFRQTMPGDWDGVMDRVVAALDRDQFGVPSQ